jgi:glycosyltransferase involved in cell wall biosynthesis
VPIAYVMEQTLGNITHYLNLREAVLPVGQEPPHWVPIEYRASKLPWTLTGGWLARRELQARMRDVDGVFIHTMTLALASTDLFSNKPFVLSCDATPAAKQHMRSAYGMASQHAVSEWLKRTLYKQMLGRAAGFVAWSTWAKQSLVRDYGCAEASVATIPPGIDLNAFAPRAHHNPVPRILFVGGDFERKGGDLLLRVFRKSLRGSAELIIVSRDAVPAEPGVTVHRDVAPNSATLKALYASSDIFVLPTRADAYSIVAMEALACGLPVIITRIGGAPDIVREGTTGHVIDVDDEAALERALLALVREPDRREHMARAARAHAVEHFDAGINARKLFEFVSARCAMHASR